MYKRQHLLTQGSGHIAINRSLGDGWILDTRLSGVRPSLNGRIGRSLAMDEKGEVLISELIGIEGAGDGIVVHERNANGWEKTALIPLFGTLSPSSVALALSGDGSVIAINGYDEIDNKHYVFVFKRQAQNRWELDTKLLPPSTEGGYFFAKSISVDFHGRTIAFGQPWDSSIARGINDSERMTIRNESGGGSGAVHLYEFKSGVWQHLFIKASNPGARDGFGTDVSLSRDGRFLAVGAPSEESASRKINHGQDDNSCNFCGATYVFEKTDDEWRQQAYIKSKHNDYGDSFGESLALNEDATRLIVGAPGASHPYGEGNAHGGIFIFDRLADKWQMSRYWVAEDNDFGDDLGSQAVISNKGDLAIANAPGKKVHVVDGAGVVYMPRLDD